MAFPILALKEGENENETGKGWGGGVEVVVEVGWWGHMPPGDRFCHLFQLGPDVFSGT